MVTYIIRRLLWSVLLLFVVSFITFVMFYPAAVGGPGAPARRPQPDAGAGRGDPRAPRARQALVRPVLDLHAGPGLPLRLRLLLPEQRRRPARRSSTACRPPISLALGAAVVWLLIGIPIGIISAIKRGTLLDRARDGRRAAGDLRAGLLGRPRLDLPLLRRTSASSPRSSRAPASTRRSRTNPVAVGLGADPALARARDRVRGDLRPLPAREPARRDGRGLHPHRPRQGPRRAARGLQARRCARRSRRSSRSSASTSASCSAARSSRRPSSTSRASAASPSTRSRRATCRSCRAPC